MRKAPLNVIAVTGVCLALWAVTALTTAGYIGDRVDLSNITASAFVLLYRIVLSCAAVAGLVGTLVWLIYGARPGRALALARAKRVWTGIWFVELLVSGGAVVGLLVRLITESLSFGNIGFLFLMTSLHTWVFFWLSSLIFSPRTVQRVPWASR